MALGGALIGALRVTLGIDASQFEDGLRGATRHARQLERRMQRVGRNMQSVGRTMTLGLTAPIAALGVSSLRAAGDFEQGMNRVAAVSGATADELERMSDLAKEMGRTTQFTAGQAADALGFLAMAGFNAEQSMAALPHTLTLAASAQMDLGEAADIVSNVLSGYAMETEDLARVNDVLVATFTSTNTNLQQLGEAMTYAAPVAAAAGIQFEEASAAIGLMGNAGIQATMAGTSLRGALTRMLDSNIQSKLAELGVTVTDAEGRLLSLTEIVRQLEPHADNTGAMMEIFGQRAGPAMLALISQGADGLANLTTELENAGGTAERIAARQMEGFNGAMRRLQSAFEGFQIALAESGLIDWVASLATGLASLLTKMAEWSPTTLKVMTAIAALVAVVGPLLWMAGSMVRNVSALIPLFTGWGASSGAAATGTGALSGALAGLRVALRGVMAALGPIALAIGAAWLVWENWDTIGPILGGVWDKLVEVFGPTFTQLFNQVKTTMTELWEGPFGDAIRDAWDAIKELGNVLVELWQGPMGDGIRAAMSMWIELQSTVLSVAGTVLVRVISALVTAIGEGFRQIGRFINMVVALFRGEWGEAWEYAKEMVSGWKEGVLNILDALVPGARESLTNFANTVKEWILDKIQPFIDAHMALWDGLVEHFRLAVDFFKALFRGDWSEAWNLAKQMASNAIETIGNVLQALVPNALGYLRDLYNGVREWISNRLGAIWDGLMDRIERVKEGFYNLYDAVVGHSYIPDMVDGIREQMQRLDAVMVQPAERATSATAQAFRELQGEVNGILARLFPQEARMNEYLREREAISRATFLTEAQRLEALTRLRREYYLDDPLNVGSANDNDKPDINVLGDDVVDPILASAEEIAEATADMELEVEEDTGQIIAHFAEMARNVVGSLRNMVNSFKSGDILGGIQGILDMVLQVVNLIGMVSGKPAIPSFGGAGPSPMGFSTGGSFKVGGSGGVDSQLVRFKATPGEMVTVRRGDQMNAANDIHVYVTKGEMFDAHVERVARPLADQAAVRGTLGGAAKARMDSIKASRGRLG